jgi:rRNA maturation RNase YbeY|tara:strand:- start:909 stop:1334 length:426 start_codon:yes stop_codon:yes gene_type:complete
LDIQVNLGPYKGAPGLLLKQAIHQTLIEDGRTGAFSITLLGDQEMGELNARYLGRNAPTDVLAFSMGTTELPLGDVYVCLDQASRQAKEHEIPLAEELVRLVVHGVLHVLGHDHPEDSDRFASPMFKLQERLVRQVFKHPE